MNSVASSTSFVSQLFSELWTKKTHPIEKNPEVSTVPTSPPTITLSPAEADKVTQTLEFIRPALEFIHNPEKHNVIGVLPYVVAVITVLGLSGLVFRVKWKKGSLNQFVQTQYKALVQWSRKRYFTIVQEKTQRELSRQLRKQDRRRKERLDTEEYQRQKAAQSWTGFFKDKLAGMAPHTMIQNLLDPTSTYSWGLLGSMWVQYMTGTHLPYIGSQLPFGAVASATAAKLILFVGYLVRKLIRSEIYGDDYDPLLVRLPNALLLSFLELLHTKLTKMRIAAPNDEENTSGDAELDQLRKEISDLRQTQKFVVENITELSDSDVQKPVNELAKAMQDIQGEKQRLDQYKTEMLNRLKSWTRSDLLELRPLTKTEFCGSVTRASSWSSWVEYTDEVYLKVWILMAEYILKFVGTQEKFTQEVAQLGHDVDETKNKKNPWSGSNSWSQFKLTISNKDWETQRNALVDLRKYITKYLLHPTKKTMDRIQNMSPAQSIRHMTLDVLSAVLIYVRKDKSVGSLPPDSVRSTDLDTDVPFELFLTKSQQELLSSAQSNIERSGERSVVGSDESITLSDKNAQLGAQLIQANELIQAITQELRDSRDTYVHQVRLLHQRHKITIPLCQAACQLLQYYTALKDGFDVSMLLYEKNLTLTYPQDWIKNPKTFLDTSTLYNALYSSDVPMPSGVSVQKQHYVIYSEALENFYTPFVTHTQSFGRDGLKTVMDFMCSVYHLSMKLDPPIKYDKPQEHEGSDDSSEEDGLRSVAFLRSSSIKHSTLHVDDDVRIHASLKHIRKLYRVSDQCEDRDPTSHQYECLAVKEDVNTLKLPPNISSSHKFRNQHLSIP